MGAGGYYKNERMKQGIFVTILLLFVATVYGTPRKEITINDGWYFHKGNIALENNDFDTPQWIRLNLPHTWNSLDAFDDEPGYYRGIGWYAYTFFPNVNWNGQDIILHFEGANQVAEVYVNNQSVGKHIGGYTAFNFNITPYLSYGKKNIIKVKLDNSHNKDIPPLNADFTFYGGIYRNVKLMAIDPIHFDVQDCASEGVFIETPKVNEHTAEVTVRGTVVNSGSTARNIIVLAKVLDKMGNVVVQKTERKLLTARSSQVFNLKDLLIDQPQLWSPETPYLYHVVTSIIEQGKKATLFDEASVAVGMRWFRFDGNGFYLNGKKYALKGTNRHQDFQGNGNALTDDYHRRDFEKIKSIGFNFVRLAHYPQAPEVYRTCDELGLLVWSEIPVVNEVTPSEAFTDNCLTMMREQIRQTYNHPSVILYGYMNEILIKMLSNSKLTEEQRQKVATDTRRLALKLDSLTKKEAPYRNTVMAIHYEDGYNKYNVCTIPDVVGYNLYFGWYYEQREDLTRFLNEEHRRYPNRPIIISEIGADADFYNHTEVPRSFDFSQEYQVVFHHSALKQMAAMNFLAGYALWNFADFGAENRTEATPFINKKGLVGYDRREKEVLSLYRANLLKTPIVYIAAHNYTTREGCETSKGVCENHINVFSNGKEVELKLNGTTLGRKELDVNMAGFDVPFVSGLNRLEAVDDRGVRDEVAVQFQVIPLNLNELDKVDVAVNVGSYQSFITPNTGVIWVPDRQYVKGSWGRIGGMVREKDDRQLKVGISQHVTGTNSNALYQTFVEGIEKYRFDVKDGRYRITLCFVEGNPKTPAEDVVYNLSGNNRSNSTAGSRQFSVSVNDNSVIDNLNLARDYGNLRAVEYTTEAKAVNGEGIEVRFTPVSGKTTLSGIRIESIGLN
jgi:beta-galactosidase